MSLSTQALAAPPPNRGLERVCEEIKEDVTPGETLAAAFDVARKPPPCDLNAERGICLFGRSQVYVDTFGGGAIVPVEAVDAGQDEQPIYVYTAFDTNAGTGKRAADIYVDGELLAVGVPADAPIYVEGFLKGTPLTKWTHVVVAHVAGKTYRLELPADVTLYKEGRTEASLRGLVGRYDFDDSSAQDLSSTSRRGEVYAELQSTVSVPFYTVTVE